MSPRTLIVLVALAVAALALTACVHAPPPEPVTVTEKVSIPVKVTCAAEEPKLNGYPDTDAALRGAANLFERVKLLMEARALRPANEAILRAARAGCVGVTLSAPGAPATP
jgi:hypothetical protein